MSYLKIPAPRGVAVIVAEAISAALAELTVAAPARNSVNADFAMHMVRVELILQSEAY
jgi:hypothetical protein